VIDLSKETPLPLKTLCSLVPPGRNGRKTHISTVMRWILHGVKSPTGEIVRLEALRLGARWVSSREALQRFSERLTPHLENAPAERPLTLAQRERAAERAGRKLEQLGI
jgi:hypothetical protein